jgi:hypothetical protein
MVAATSSSAHGSVSGPEGGDIPSGLLTGNCDALVAIAAKHGTSNMVAFSVDISLLQYKDTSWLSRAYIDSIWRAFDKRFACCVASPDGRGLNFAGTGRGRRI